MPKVTLISFHSPLNHFHRSSLIDHTHNIKHQLFLEHANILDKEDNYLKHKSRDGLEIVKLPLNLNRDSGWGLTKSWIPLLLQKMTP